MKDKNGLSCLLFMHRTLLRLIRDLVTVQVNLRCKFRTSSPQSEAEACMMAFSSAKTTLYPTPLRILAHHLSLYLFLYQSLIKSVPSVGRRCIDVLTYIGLVAYTVSRAVLAKAVVL